MTLQTWKEEFYPTPADEVSEQDAVAHSLQKWRGLRKENLERHELRSGHHLSLIGSKHARKDGDLNDGEYLLIDADSCALCHYYIRPNTCCDCPIFKETGYRCDDGVNSPYMAWIMRSDPEPMIAALEQTLANIAHIR